MQKFSAILLTMLLNTIGVAQDNGYNFKETHEDTGAVRAIQKEPQARDMYLAYAADTRKKTRKRRGRPGARVRIELLRNGTKKFVPLHTVFRAGDKVKFHFAVNFPAHVKITNLGSSGRLSQLFPYEGAPEVVDITQNYTVPHREDLWFEFDKKPGVERLTFIFSTARLSDGSSTDMQTVLSNLNSQSLENGRDLNMVQDSGDEGYVLCDEQRLEKPLGFQVSLRHR